MYCQRVCEDVLVNRQRQAADGGVADRVEPCARSTGRRRVKNSGLEERWLESRKSVHCNVDSRNQLKLGCGVLGKVDLIENKKEGDRWTAFGTCLTYMVCVIIYPSTWLPFPFIS
jgi:hypothetical protein